MLGNTEGASNTALGNNALQCNTTADSNTAVGRCSLRSNTTGTENTAVGKDALKLNVGAIQNTAVGTSALRDNTTGACNTAVGFNSLVQSTTGSNNTAMGREALFTNTTGCRNTAMGVCALNANTTGISNQAFGYQSLKAVTTGDYNIGVGHRNYLTLTTGSFNTGVGDDTGICIVSGSNNLLLGANAGRSNSPSGELTGSASNNVVLGNDNITNLWCADTSISSSDLRDKTDIEDFTHGLDFVTKLKPKTYRWDKRSWYVTGDESVLDVTPDGSKKKNKKHIGFMAQDVLALEQEIGFGNNSDDMLVVNQTEDETRYGLKYERLVPVLVNAIKELKAEIELLKNK
jgi:hypothetical protein